MIILDISHPTLAELAIIFLHECLKLAVETCECTDKCSL